MKRSVQSGSRTAQSSSRTASATSDSATSSGSSAKQSTDLVLLAKVVLITAAFFAALWALDQLVNT